MADKRISDFATLEQVFDDDLLLIASGKDDETFNVKLGTLAKAYPSLYIIGVKGSAGQGYTAINYGRLLEAIEAGRLPICYWEHEKMYLPMSHHYSDSDVVFSAVMNGVEYYVNLDPTSGRIYKCSASTLGKGGTGGTYVGSEEPEDGSITLWIDPENDTPSDLARVLYVTVTEQDGILVADHYYDEIAAALDQGYMVSCQYINGTYCLLSRGDNQVVFGNLYGATNTQIRIGTEASAIPVMVVTNVLVPAPSQANPGQVLAVKSVDEAGSPRFWEPVDLPVGGSDGAAWQLIGEVDTTEPVSSVSITGDTVFTELIALVTVPPIPEDTGGVTYVRPVLKNKGAINANVGFNKPSTLLQREFWYINRHWGIRQYWQTGANTIANTVTSFSSDTIGQLNDEFNNGGGILGFNISWNQNNTFPAGVKMRVWGR